MVEQANICWYRIQKCGYYKGPRAATPAFGNLPEVLEDILRWCPGKQLAQTLTFNPNDDDSEDEQLPVYLLDFRGAGDNWLLKLWNETPAIEGKVASIPQTAVVGGGGVVMNELAPDTIPGIATYFYFVPSMNAVAAIRFKHRVLGHASMRRYISGFVRQKGRHICWSNQPDESGNFEMLGYAANALQAPVNYFPQFRSEIMKLPGRREELVRSARDVKRAVRRIELKSGRRPDRSFWQKLMENTGLSAPRVAPDTVRVQYELSTTMDPTSMDNLIAEWEEARGDHDGWEDIGFVFRGEQTPQWISRSIARGTIPLDVEWENEEVVSTQSLLNQLISHRDAITALCRATNST